MMETPKRILIIEDEPGLLEAVTYLLKHAGYTLFVARDGREGLNLAQQERPDLILTDLMLPGMSGYEICSFLKQDVRYQQIPIMMWSASKVQQKDADMAKECGADEFVIKTLSPQALLEKIKQLLSKSKSQ